MFNQDVRQKQPKLQQIHLSHQKCRIDDDLFELEKEHFLMKLEIAQQNKTSIPQKKSIKTSLIPSDASCQSKPCKSILKYGSEYKKNSHQVRFRI